jgi:hypothetical protein
MATLTPTELRLQNRNDRLEMLINQQEELLRERGEGNLSDTDKGQLERMRSEQSELITEIDGLVSDKESHDKAVERSKAIRASMLGANGGTEFAEDGVVYRDFLSYARDELLARSVSSSGELAHLATSWGGENAVAAAQARLQLLKRTPATTLTSDLAGLNPAQHIAQIFQVIETSRPIVQSAQRTTLERLTLNYPRVDGKPIVAVQASQKTEAGNVGLDISMQTTTAATYLGGGNISWQAAQFSTPNALDLWFKIVTADYALKTEQDAAQAMQHSAFDYNIASTLGSTPTFAQFMTAVGAGGSDVYTNSGRDANTVYMAPDVWWWLFGTTSDAAAQFTTVTGDGVGPLRFIKSRGMDAGVAVVGDSNGLLVAENAGAPVELRVTEPAIGGFEVGLIGAFEAVVVDAGAFAMITTAS